eukprot:CAMPEP_0179192150 /NCGR_PEP_ID=MMETSP0796-20121207/95453_1 /TAXON_ID=73915 /ORGANISM="Pyrodinium bahamense, Strain pbaha01" /LENGTH=34 /DNA_ID= /DNA_START= /DNA_END= /DNA_ORIENTATION=
MNDDIAWVVGGLLLAVDLDAPYRCYLQVVQSIIE